MKAMHAFYSVLLLGEFFSVLVETKQVQTKQSYLPQYVANSTVEFFRNNVIMSPSRQGKQNKINANIPKCKYVKFSG